MKAKIILMKPRVTVQYAIEADSLPSEQEITKWVHHAIPDLPEDKEITIRIVNENESAELNNAWREKNKPTNVLSFNYEDDIEHNDLFGDLVICAPVVEFEAKQQGKSLKSHWAHLIIHGSLHLLGYDHINSNDAEIMESKEQEFMHNLGYENPYKSN